MTLEGDSLTQRVEHLKSKRSTLYRTFNISSTVFPFLGSSAVSLYFLNRECSHYRSRCDNNLYDMLETGLGVLALSCFGTMVYTGIKGLYIDMKINILKGRA